jgi:adenosylcobinamide kinase/adenosylcobinamide-phosphate guanylyltransferase
MSNHIQLILGGARSGKSRFALSQGDEKNYNRKIFLATALPLDDEMNSRIARHQRERDPVWITLEEPYHLREKLETNSQMTALTVIDCATLWLSNLLCGVGGPILSPPQAEEEIDRLIKIFPNLSGIFRLVTNEVGLGIIPDNLLSRQFCDLQGRLNQKMANIAGEVILMTAGIPRKIK